MKGIVLAAGNGTRLLPMTDTYGKSLVLVFDKPLIYFPIATLMLAGIRDILVITTQRDKDLFQRLLGNGSEYGINLEYAIQKSSNGIAEAFIIGENFIGDEKVSLILGDNIFHGNDLGTQLESKINTDGAIIFGYRVNNASHYGVPIFNHNKQLIKIEEKPQNPESNMAVTGLYFYDNSVISKSKKLTPSARYELEITDLNNIYISEGSMVFEELSRGSTWFDTGTFKSLHDAATYIRIIEERQGSKVACLEEIAWRKGWISSKELLELCNYRNRTNIRDYLLGLLDNSSKEVTF